jgi:hypothetical protein
MERTNMDYVDDNPDNPNLISRRFQNPLTRLEDIGRRIKERQYLDVTIGTEYNPKYLFELYYDFLFMSRILAKLGVMFRAGGNNYEYVFYIDHQDHSDAVVISAISAKLNEANRLEKEHC